MTASDQQESSDEVRREVDRTRLDIDATLNRIERWSPGKIGARA